MSRPLAHIVMCGWWANLSFTYSIFSLIPNPLISSSIRSHCPALLRLENGEQLAAFDPFPLDVLSLLCVLLLIVLFSVSGLVRAYKLRVLLDWDWYMFNDPCYELNKPTDEASWDNNDDNCPPECWSEVWFKHVAHRVNPLTLSSSISSLLALIFSSSFLRFPQSISWQWSLRISLLSCSILAICFLSGVSFIIFFRRTNQRRQALPAPVCSVLIYCLRLAFTA